MVFPALALLLWWSPPVRPNTRWLVGVVTLYALARLLAPGPLAQQAVNALSLVGAACFLPLMLRTRASAVDGAIVAVLLGAAAVLGWFLAFHIDPSLPIREMIHWERLIFARVAPITQVDPAELDLVTDFYARVIQALPGIMMLVGVGACVTLWRWYHILAAAPVGLPPAEFTEFRFNDQLLWLMVAGTTGLVAQGFGHLDPQALWPLNLVVFAGGLYVGRGLAVVRARTGPWPLPVLLMAAIAVLLLSPIFVTALFGLGVADTWHDFRRRPAPPSGD